MASLRPALVLACMAIPVLGTAAADGPTRFDADIGILSPVQWGGSLLAATPPSAFPLGVWPGLREDGVPGVALEAREVWLEIHERRSRSTAFHEHNLTLQEPIHRDETSQTTTVTFDGATLVRTSGEVHMAWAALRVSEARPEASLLLGNEWNQGSVAFPASAACDAAPAPAAAPAHLDRLLGLPSAQGGLPDIRRILGVEFMDNLTLGRVACQTPEIRFVGLRQLGLWGLTMDVDYVDARNSSYEHLTVATGAFVVPDPSVAGSWQRIERFAFLNVSSPGADFRLAVPERGPPLRVEARLAAAEAVGDLRIPAGTGLVRWGALALNGSTPPVDVAGAFTLLMGRVGRMEVRGLAMGSGPALREPGESRSLRGLVPVALALVATVPLIWLGRKLAPLLVALYTRVTSSTAAQHPRRQLILEFLTANPGSSIQQIGQGLMMARGVVLHHVRQLASGGIVSVRNVGRVTAVFVTGSFSPHEQERLAHTRRRAIGRALEFVAQNPGLGQADLVRRLGLSQPYVSQILQRLVDLGLVSATAVNGRTVYAAADASDASV